MRRNQKIKFNNDALQGVETTLIRIGSCYQPRSRVSYYLFFPLAEKSKVVGVKPEVRFKRVSHVLHREDIALRRGYKSSSQMIGGTRVCLRDYKSKLIGRELL